MRSAPGGRANLLNSGRMYWQICRFLAQFLANKFVFVHNLQPNHAEFLKLVEFAQFAAKLLLS